MLYSLANAVFLAAEEGDEPEGIDLLLPETAELWAGIVAFGIIFFVVWRFALPALNKTLAARQEAISSQYTEAEKSKTEAEGLLRDYKDQVAGAREEANTIVEEARQAAEAMRADILAKANADADEIRRRAQEDLAAERERANADLRAEVAALSLDVAEKVTAGSIDRSASQRLVDQFIDELGGMRS